MVFADDIVICEETREEVERRLECWRYVLERRGMKGRLSVHKWRKLRQTVKMENTKVTKNKEN